MIRFFKRHFVALTSLCVGLFFTCLNFIYYSPIELHEHDSIAWILAGVAPILKIGVAYKDYWDRMPPGLALLTFSWAKIFGYTDLSFQILHFVSILALVPLFYLVFRKINSSILLLPVLVSSFLISFAPVQMEYRLTSEQLGLLFALLGLTLLLYKRNGFFSIFSASFCLFLAGQMKDPFMPILITLVPLFVYFFLTKKSQFIQALTVSLAGLFSGLSLITSYLLYSGNLKDYLEILKYKSSIFGVFDFYRLIYYLYKNIHLIIKTSYRFQEAVLLLPLVIGVIIIIGKVLVERKINLGISNSKLIITNKLRGCWDLERITDLALIIFFILGNYLGFSLQGDPSSHRLIQVVLPLNASIFLLSLLAIKPLSSIFLKKLNNKKNSFIFANFLTLLIITVFTFPEPDIAHSYGIKFARQKLMHFSLVKKPENSIFDFINQQTNPEDCVLRYYGWGVDQTYYYSQRKPCTKFIKPALIMNYPKYLGELKEELKSNPPALIHYTTEGADMNVEKFEREVVNLKEIIKNCYKETSRESIYLPKEKDEKKFKECYYLFFD